MILKTMNYKKMKTMRRVNMVKKRRLLAAVVFVGCCIFGLGVHNTVYIYQAQLSEEVSLLKARQRLHVVERSSNDTEEDQLLISQANGDDVSQGNAHIKPNFSTVD